MMGSGVFSPRPAGPGRGAAEAPGPDQAAYKADEVVPAASAGAAIRSASVVPSAPAAAPAGAATGQPGTFMVMWSPGGDAAGELLWQAGLCLAGKKRTAILADLDLYTPGLAVAAGLLVPGVPVPGVLDACLTQQLPALAVSVGPDGLPASGRRLAPRLLSPEGQPLLRVLPGLFDLRGIDMLVPVHLEALANWLKSESGWRIAAVSAPCDCAATVACLAVADRLVLHVPHYQGRSAALIQLWLARAAHLLQSLPGVQARPELWLPGWDAKTAQEVGAHLQCPAYVLPVGGRRRMDALTQLLGLKPEPPVPAPRGEILAVR